MTGYLTVRETAELLNMHFMSVYKLVQSGQLPALKIGSRWKIDPDQLGDWLARRRGAPREWLLLGSDAALAQDLAQVAPPGHRLGTVGYGQLNEALQLRPEVVLIDPAPDPAAALAALDLCQSQESPPLAVWLLRETDRDHLSPALDLGLLTILSLPPTAEAMTRLAALLPGPENGAIKAR